MSLGYVWNCSNRRPLSASICHICTWVHWARTASTEVQERQGSCCFCRVKWILKGVVQNRKVEGGGDVGERMATSDKTEFYRAEVIISLSFLIKPSMCNQRAEI